MKKNIEKVIMAFFVVIFFTFSNISPVLATSYADNLATLNENWIEPNISFENEEKIILKDVDWENISEVYVCFDEGSNFIVSQHYYCNSSDNELCIPIPSSLSDGRHAVYIAFFDETNNTINTFLGGSFAYNFVTGDSPNFKNFGIQYDNFNILKNINEELFLTAIETVGDMFDKFPQLEGVIDCITIEDSKSDEYFAENSSTGGYTTTENIAPTLSKGGNIKLGTKIAINFELCQTPSDLANVIYHEMTHVLMYVLAAQYIGINDILNTNSIECYYAVIEFYNANYEKLLQDEILIKGGYNLNDITHEIRDYATGDGEFFTSAIADALTNSNPSKLSILVYNTILDMTR